MLAQIQKKDYMVYTLIRSDNQPPEWSKYDNTIIKWVRFGFTYFDLPIW